MLSRGRAIKILIYLNEDAASDQNFTHEQVFDFLFENGVAGATLIRLQEGFGSRHQRHDREGNSGSQRHLPVRIEFIDSPEKVESILPQLCQLVTDGLIEMQETTVIKAARKEAPL